MNKGQLVDKIAENADITKASAGRALDSLIAAITSHSLLSLSDHKFYGVMCPITS